MTWNYSQSTGELQHNGVSQGSGYSGHGDDRNNPAMQNVRDVGPIPQGHYRIEPAGHPYPPKLGKAPVMALTPAQGTQTFGRSAFFIHGNNPKNDASEGCIILGPALRKMLAASDDRDLIVTA